jgi:uncharacterized protein
MIWLQPDWFAANIFDIDLKLLHAHGIRGLVFDLDNTLMPPSKPELWDEVADWLCHAQNEGFILAVASNNPRSHFIQQAQTLLGIPVIGSANKPSPGKILQLLQTLGLTPQESVLIGDRPTTDVWAGHRAGMHTILTRPLMQGREPLLYTVLRWLEWKTLRPGQWHWMQAPKV